MAIDFLNDAKLGKNVFITDVRNNWAELSKKDDLVCVLRMIDGESNRVFRLQVPELSNSTTVEIDFIKTYIHAEIHNILSVLGGMDLTFYIDKSKDLVVSLVSELKVVFCIGDDLKDRKGFGRSINVIDRMLKAVVPPQNGQYMKFKLIIKDLSEFNIKEEDTNLEPGNTDVFKKCAQGIEDKVLVGLDIGGTDIKAALSIDGQLVCLKEYDWFPEKFPLADMLNDPLCIVVRLMRAKVSFDRAKNITPEIKATLTDLIIKAMDKDAAYELILEVTTKVEEVLGDSLIEIDAIGLCFPDVVVKDKVVGGEVTKTRGIRSNTEVDYEEEFAKITALDERLLKLCKTGGVVKNTNDGPMAAFTAAVELANSDQADTIKNGVFAHSLGTELGTGWVDANGEIPTIPLEAYNCIIDLGSFEEKQYLADDVRSINNFNTNLPGTLQRYTSQSGVFRLGMKYFPTNRPDLYKELFDKGLVAEEEMNGEKILTVPTKPNDMRKAFLEHMMMLVEREDDDICKEIFRQVGIFLAITWFEMQRILQPTSTARTLFGRLVKRQSCFDLMVEGAKTRTTEMKMEVANDDIAFTSLMKQLAKDEEFTVAQFAQAIGAIYYANMGLII
ncbi:MAG: hypothetical protein OCD02_01610 [Spirochaetaceae bacterium]